jgi:2-iminobutanoate/2-iminopropanoate deaminase
MKHYSLRIALASAVILSLGACTSAPKPQYLNSGKILPTTLPFSEAVKVGSQLILSGQIGNVPGSLKLVPGGISAESKQVIENIKTTLEAHGYSMSDVVKCTVILADINEWAAFNTVYQAYWKAGAYPARSAFGSSGLAFNARVELECLAAK